MKYTGSAEGQVRSKHPDTVAMDKIHMLLDGVEWSPDTLDEIARLVEATGRLIRDPEEVS